MEYTIIRKHTYFILYAECEYISHKFKIDDDEMNYFQKMLFMMQRAIRR